MFNYPNNLISTRFVEDIIHNFNGSAHLKDLMSGKYVLSNLANAVKVGLASPGEVCGLTVWDLDQKMGPFWGNLASQIERFDLEIKHKQKVIIDRNRAFLTPDGRVFVHNMKKFPLPNGKNQITSVLTINENITGQLELGQLLTFYKSLYGYGSKQKAILMFLSHVNMLDYFYELPTESEIVILITKKSKANVKDIAKALFLSPRTVDTHLGRLRQKSKIDLKLVVEMMQVSR